MGLFPRGPGDRSRDPVHHHWVGVYLTYASWKSASVKGHRELPGDGHEICPLVATRSARWRPPDGLRVQVLRGITPFRARAWDRRTLSPAVWQMCAWCISRSTVAVANVLGISSSNADG